MAIEARLYLVKIKDQPKRLVKATHPNNAARFCTDPLIEDISVHSALEAMESGLTVEDATVKDSRQPELPEANNVPAEPEPADEAKPEK